MRLIVTVVVVALVAALGFGGGYCYKAKHPTPQADPEDYAVENTMNALTYLHYLDKGQTSDLRKLLNVNLDDHLTHIRRYQGANKNSEFLKVEIRTLNAVAVYWNEHPPFKSKEFQPTESNASWYPEWQEIIKKNQELLSWAQDQCAETPSLKCDDRP